MKCVSLKSGIGEANSWRECLSRGSVSHKGTPTSMLLKHSQRVLVLGNQVFPGDTESPRSPWSRFPLRSFTKKVGVSTPPAQRYRHCSTPSRRVVDVANEPTWLQGVDTPSSSFGSLKNHSTRVQSLALLLSKELTFHNTLKYVLRTKDIITKLLNGLEMFLDVAVMFLNSSNLQMTRGWHIYSPPSP